MVLVGREVPADIMIFVTFVVENTPWRRNSFAGTDHDFLLTGCRAPQ
jgi:hypothetical protein